MVTYTAHERGDGSADLPARAEAIVFVKEGFAWWALVFPFLWLLFHRMWLALLGFVVVLLAAQGAVSAAGLSGAMAGWVTLGLSLLLALQANDLRRWTLARRGYRQAGLVNGRDREDCELRFFEGWLAAQPARAPEPPEPEAPAKQAAPGAADERKSRAGDDEVIGLFPEPGR